MERPALHSQPMTPPPPAWVDERDGPAGGRDFLGLRTATERIGYALMDGVTTVTPHVRYLTLRTWILHRYWEQRRPDDTKAFREFARRMEAAVVFANLLEGRETLHLVGADNAAGPIGSDEAHLRLDALVKNPASEIYGGAAQTFGLDAHIEDHDLRGPTEVGRALAAILDVRLRATELGQVLSDKGPPEKASRTALRELGGSLHLDRLADEERDLLIRQIYPEPTGEQVRRRLGSNALLLELARLEGRLPDEDDVFRHALEGGSELPSCFAFVLDGWALFCARNLLVAAHESVMRSVTLVLADHEGSDVAPSVVIANLCENPGLLAAPLQDLGVWHGPIEELDWPGLVEAVTAATSTDAWSRRGVRRWSGDVDERAVWSAVLARPSDAAPLSLLALAWALVLRRVGPGLDGEDGELLKHLSGSWLPIKERLLPLTHTWAKDGAPIGRVVSELAVLTVEGHLDVAWSRMQANPKSDGLFVHSDGLSWRHRRLFKADLAASRVGRQVGWLQQLGLVDDDGLTELGDGTLRAAVEALA